MKEGMLPPEVLGGLVSYLYRSAQTHKTKRLDTFNLGSGQFPFLMTLYYHDGINQETLARRGRFDKATITRAIARLEEAGYVRRERDPEDRRAYRIYLSEEGRKIEPAMRAIAAEWSEMMLAGFTGEERRQAFALLERMAGNVASATEENPFSDGGRTDTSRADE